MVLEAMNEMWLSRPYMSYEVEKFMKEAVFIPQKSTSNVEGTLIDDHGNTIKSQGRLYPGDIPENLLPKYYKRVQKESYEAKKVAYGAFGRPWRNIRLGNETMSAHWIFTESITTWL